MDTPRIDCGANDIRHSEVSAVWLRRPFVELSLEEQNRSDTDFRIWKNEWNKTLLGLYCAIRYVPWLNPLREAYRAENKYYQFEAAQALGFNVPVTIVSNLKAELEEFVVQNKGNVVMKLMGQEFYLSEEDKFKGIYVNRINEMDLQDFGGVSENPIVLQRYIEKAFEVRYTVVGDEHHVCKIESQKSNIANVDWRRYDIPNTPHSPMEPPGPIRDQVARLMSLLEISFGALDFIVSTSGIWYFLEVNAAGQWLWIVDLTGLPIAESVSKWLIGSQRGKF